MRIAAFIRTTYGEWEGRDCCRVDVRGCNLRCPFCKAPAMLRTEGEDVDPASVLAYVKDRGDTLDGVIVSGGEPLASPDLYKFLRELKSLKRPVMLMTNGCFPDALDDLIGAELIDWVSLHLPAPLEQAAYARTTNTPVSDPTAVRRSLQIMQGSGVSWDCRTVAVPGLIDGAAIVQIAKAVGERHPADNAIRFPDLPRLHLPETAALRTSRSRCTVGSSQTLCQACKAAWFLINAGSSQLALSRPLATSCWNS